MFPRAIKLANGSSLITRLVGPSIISSNVFNSPTLQLEISQSIYYVSRRNFQPKSSPDDDGTYRGGMNPRFGYEAHHHTGGLLPRLSIKERKLDTMPVTMREDPWSPRLATMGQNDFIRIFDDSMKQYDLLTHVPDWLRGYQRTGLEYSVLMRKRKEFEHWKYTKPLKWLHLEQRIKFLYRRINNKYRPPDVEKLSRSRHCL